MYRKSNSKTGNLEKSTLWIERLKPERERKSTLSKRKFHASKSLLLFVKHEAS